MQTAELMTQSPFTHPHLRRSSVMRLSLFKRETRYSGCTDIQRRLNHPLSKPPAFTTLVAYGVSFARMTDSTSPKHKNSIDKNY